MSAYGKIFQQPRGKCFHSRHLIYVDSVFPCHLVFMGSSSSKVSIYFFLYMMHCIFYDGRKMEKYFRKKNCEWSGVVVVIRNGSLKFCVFVYFVRMLLLLLPPLPLLLLYFFVDVWCFCCLLLWFTFSFCFVLFCLLVYLFVCLGYGNFM